MFKNILALTSTMVFIFSTTGCADPRYVNPSNGSNSQTQSLTNYDCKLMFKTEKLCLAWAWEIKPTENEPGSFWVRTYRLDERDSFPRLVDASSIPFVKLWMPDMGHGSSPVKVDRSETGTYRATNVYFTMPGKWQIKFQLRDGNNVLDEIIVDYTF